MTGWEIFLQVCRIASFVFPGIILFCFLFKRTKAGQAFLERWYEWKNSRFIRRKLMRNFTYLVAVYYKGRTEFLTFLKKEKTKTAAIQKAHDLLYNTLNYKAVVYLWNKKANRRESIVAEFDTFTKKEEAIELTNEQVFGKDGTKK